MHDYSTVEKIHGWMHKGWHIFEPIELSCMLLSPKDCVERTIALGLTFAT